MGDVPLIDADRILQCGCPANIPEAALRERLLLARQEPVGPPPAWHSEIHGLKIGAGLRALSSIRTATA